MKITVFASSQMTDYSKEVRYLGRNLGEAGHALVFGGCDNGLMHEIAEGFSQANAEVTGVVPAFFKGRKIHSACRSVVVTNDLTDRKEKMIALADIFLVLPGGVGTMDELFTVLAQKSVGAYFKPVYLFNPDGFYDSLIQTLDNMHHNGAIREEVQEIIHVFRKPEEILERIGHA